MARLRSARLAKATDNAATDTKVPSGTELTVQAGTKEPCQAVQVGSKEPCAAELTVQAGSKEPCVAELALQTALKMKERIRNNVVAREVGSGLDVSNLQREPEVLTLESNKSSGMSKLRRGLHQLSSTLDPGIRIKDSVYFEFGVTQAGSVHGSGEEAVMKNSVITADFEVKQKVPEVFPSRHALERMKKAEKGKSTGKQWFDMAAPELTSELKSDLKALQLRNAFDPKQHYRANDSKQLPKYFQVGRVVAGPAEFYSARIPRRQQKRSLVEELFADEELRRYQKKKYAQIQRKHQSGTYRLKKIKHGKKFKHGAA